MGIPEPAWLAWTGGVPVFVSHIRLRRRVNMPVAEGPWALDSGGFTELGRHGRWTIEPEEYVEAVYRYREAGGLQWASPQDWMCEEVMLAKTGKTVREHQELTVANYLELITLAPDLPFIPVLQGWKIGDYHRCVDLYHSAGVRLEQAPLVGVGSVCRRQDTEDIRRIMVTLAGRGLALHGFGVKLQGLERYADALVSSDSMAWSLGARKRHIRLPECTHRSADCRNCFRWARRWRDQLVTSIA